MIEQLPSGKWYCHEHKSTKCECIIKFTSNSQAITSNSQGVLKRRYVRRVKGSVFERFHNFGVRFDAQVDWSALFVFPEVRLNNNVFYKRLDFPEAIVKVFKKSILVSLRSCMELKGLDVKVAEAKSKELVSSVVSRLPKSIRVKGFDVVNVHNAFVNHPVARFPLRVEVDGTTRLISDHSKGFGEFEAVSPSDAVSDSVLIEEDLKGLIKDGLSRKFLANALNVLIKDREYYAENLRSHVEAIRSLKDGIDVFNAQIGERFTSHASGSTSFSSPHKGSGRVELSSITPVRVDSALPVQSNLSRWFE